MKPRISIIIPCYNQGHFLKDVLDSVEKCQQELIEVIIVNDGSTDEMTNKVLKDVADKGYTIIFQENKGLSAARNAGIDKAIGDYILPLDADNKIRPDYITKSISILDQMPQVAVVYGNAEFFGDKTGRWDVGSFNMQRLMIVNFIDACAVIRKSALLKAGKYDTNLKLGWEDWDLWLRLAFADWEFYYINEVLFDYRVSKNSMARKLYSNYEKPNSIESYLSQKYPGKIGFDEITDNYVKRFKKHPFLFVIKLILRSYFRKYYDKLLRKNKIRRGL